MNRAPVESSQIKSIGFENGVLEIEFVSHAKDGRLPSIYQYVNVTTEDHAALIGAESIGRHFGAFIKPFPNRYPYTKVQ